MSIDYNQLKNYVVVSALEDMDMYSKSAVNLLLGTAAQESKMGTYIKQNGGGPALGIFQIEQNTYYDIVTNYINNRSELKRRILSVCYFTHIPSCHELISNLKFSTIIARIFYLRIAEALPNENDIEGMAKYWKKYYNTNLGKGTVDEFVRSYNQYVG